MRMVTRRMCFSATGSFGVATVLAGIGAVTLTQVKPASHRLFATTPLLFAVQQASEGVVWLTMGSEGSRVHHAAVATFLVFALVVWPTWVPLSLLPIERSPARKKALGILFALGICVSTYAAWLLFQGRPAAHVTGHSLAYSYAETGRSLVIALYLPVYATAAVVPFFVSSMEKAKLMGVVLVASLVATFVIERNALTSVWCFFAAILSGLVVLSIALEQREHVKRSGRPTPMVS
jgi:hypothetical protein